MNHIKAFKRVGQSVGLVELKGETWLWLYINPHNLKSCPVIPHGSTTRPAEEIKKAWIHGVTSFPFSLSHTSPAASQGLFWT